MAGNIKVGVRVGGGPPPGYQWNVWVTDLARDEASGELDEDQYQHMALQVKDLAREADPTHSRTASVDAIEDFHELRDSGGILGGKNIRVFFYLDKERKALLVLGVINKQNNGPTPIGDKKRMSRRLRKYLSGELSGP